ncbi:sensor histidine kinase [Kitasatospora sp. NPDC057500]|uniref:sensor histidine kinase n=1 Tax=Kitasatospora sp. NPDC057500 TaxID=3346151 RepID=UPI0036CF902C
MITALRSAAGPRAAVNTALGTVFAAVLSVMAAQYASQGRPWAFDTGVGLLVCVIALAREWNRAWAAVAGLVVAGGAAVIARLADLPGEPGPGAVLALLVLGGSAIRALPRRQAGSIAAGGLVLMVSGWLTQDGPSTAFRVGTEVWVLALGVGLLLRFLDYRRRTAAEAVRHDERLILARELHDVVAHHITGIVVQAQAARIVGRSRPETLDGTLAGIEGAGAEALAAMRRVVGLLRDTDDVVTTSPAPHGLDHLPELVQRFEGHGPDIELRLPTEPLPWPPEVDTTVYRIVQESLTNIARHASQARSAVVDIAQDREAVTISITNDVPAGHGRARHLQKGGFGLIGMRERVEALGGTLTVGPEAGAGWSVLATVPVLVKESR